jgi:hypothetical protein
MALITCKDCDKEISTAASACPDCGKPQTPAPTKGHRLAARAFLLFMAILGIAFVIDLIRGPEPTKSDPPDLKGSLALRGGMTFILENKDDFDWTDCEIIVNPAGLGANGFDLTLTKVAAHSTREIDSSSLATAEGARFDLQTHKLKTFYVRCSTPAGTASTSWTPRDS